MYGRLLELWVRGLNIDWNRLYGERRPLRVSLPGYPFSPESYWIPETFAGNGPENSGNGTRPAGVSSASVASSEHLDRGWAPLQFLIQRQRILRR